MWMGAERVPVLLPPGAGLCLQSLHREEESERVLMSLSLAAALGTAELEFLGVGV